MLCMSIITTHIIYLSMYLSVYCRAVLMGVSIHILDVFVLRRGMYVDRYTLSTAEEKDDDDDDEE